MTDDALPLAGAALRLERRMITLARSIAADVPPRVLEVRFISGVEDVAVMLAIVDCQFETVIAIPCNVLIEGETIGTIVQRLAQVRPRLDAPSVH
jgi:hypothetical protein